MFQMDQKMFVNENGSMCGLVRPCVTYCGLVLPFLVFYRVFLWLFCSLLWQNIDWTCIVFSRGHRSKFVSSCLNIDDILVEEGKDS